MGIQYFLDNTDTLLHSMKNRAYAYKKADVISDDIILKYLKEWGISQKLAGFLYLKDALNYLIKGNGKVSLSKEIYPLLALKYDSSPSTIEKSIRYAISSSGRRDIDKNTCCGNKEFINMIKAEVLADKGV